MRQGGHDGCPHERSVIVILGLVRAISTQSEKNVHDTYIELDVRSTPRWHVTINATCIGDQDVLTFL